MKKIITLATFALLVTGVAFAGEGKKCSKGKGCCKDKKEMKSEKAKTTQSCYNSRSEKSITASLKNM